MGAVHERRWPASLTVLTVLALQLALPDAITTGLRWVLPAVEVLLLLPVLATNPLLLTRDSRFLHGVSITLIYVLAVANAVHLLQLVAFLTSGRNADGDVLVQAALLIWVTNVATMALAMWEMDRGGPFARAPRHERASDPPDLLFPQMSGVPGWDAGSWHPGFLDYLFVAFTSATAFSPTDTMPLSARAKLAMAFAATISLLTLAVVAARAVNVL